MSPLQMNDLLSRAALLKAEDMLRRDYFSHRDPDGQMPWYWLDRVGYDYLFAGENLALNFNDSKKVMKAWLDSPSHRANLMNENYTEIGIGVAEGLFEGKEVVLAVQFFGLPAKKINQNQIVKSPKLITSRLADSVNSAFIFSWIRNSASRLLSGTNIQKVKVPEDDLYASVIKSR